MHRERVVFEAEAQVGNCLGCRARITSKELAPIHSVKNSISQNACSTSRRMDADLGKSALMRIARLKNSLAEWSKKNGDKSVVAMLKITTTIGLRISRIWSRRSLHRFYERAQTYGNRSDV